jgi:hypothetical protein
MHPRPKPPSLDGTPPLTRGLFRRVIYVIIMNIALEFRPVKIRLYVAYIADALSGGFKPCDPGNTWTRAMHHIESGSPSDYRNMWDTIHRVYDQFRWYELSDDEIVDLYSTYISSGYTNGTRKITGMDIMNAKRRWDERGWKRYESKRNGRRTVARMATVPVLACFGIVLPQ